MRTNLKEWGLENYRDFPWRKSHSPYHILMAEMMLQRTNAKQVEKVYSNFVSNYATPSDLIKTPLAKIQKELNSLGLNWRINKIIECSRSLSSSFNNQVPENQLSLMSLPGVGQYISGALLIIAFNKKATPLDSNIVRIIGRFFGLQIKENSRRNKLFSEILGQILPENELRTFFFSLLDFAFFICKPLKPKCDICPIQDSCIFIAF